MTLPISDFLAWTHVRCPNLVVLNAGFTLELFGEFLKILMPGIFLKPIKSESPGGIGPKNYLF